MISSSFIYIHKYIYIYIYIYIYMGSLCFGFSVLRCSIRSSRACVKLGKKRDYALYIYIYCC